MKSELAREKIESVLKEMDGFTIGDERIVIPEEKRIPYFTSSTNSSGKEHVTDLFFQKEKLINKDSSPFTYADYKTGDSKEWAFMWWEGIEVKFGEESARITIASEMGSEETQGYIPFDHIKPVGLKQTFIRYPLLLDVTWKDKWTLLVTYKKAGYPQDHSKVRTEEIPLYKVVE